MNTFATIFFAAAVCVLSVNAASLEREKREGLGTKTGVAAGAVAGGLAGGPLGAVVGAIGGGILGHEVHKVNHPKVEVIQPVDSNGAVVSQPAMVAQRVKREGAGTKTGALGGAVAGAAIGGPLGAVVGGVGGAIAGHELHKVNHPKVDVATGQRVKREGAGTKTGALGGAVAGAAIGGPLGAVVGGVGGAIAGHELHKVNHPKVDVATGQRVKREGAGTKTGALGGAVAGAAIGGPLGAVVGGVGGAIAGHELHKVNHPKPDVVAPAQQGAVVA